MDRPAFVRVLVGLAAVAAALALIAGYVRRAAVDPDQFANRATAALRDPSVRSLVAERVTDQVVLKHRSDLIGARPLIQTVTETVVASRPFTDLFRAGVRDVHRAVFERDRDSVSLTVLDAGTVVGEALQQLRPSVAKRVEATGKVELLQRKLGEGGGLARVADRVKVLSWLLLAVALALMAAALALSPDRRRTVVDLGVALAVAGTLMVIAYAVLRRVAVQSVEGPQARAAAGAVWDAFLRDLRTASWVLAASGAIVAAAGSSLIRPVPIGEPLRRAAAWVGREPAGPGWKVARGAGLVLAGVVVLTQRDAVLDLLLSLAGVYLVYEGIAAVLRVVNAGQPAARPGLPGRRLAGAVLAAVAVAVLAAGFVANGGTTTAAPARGACNGHRALCDRPLARVVLAATHNSMSGPSRDHYNQQQDAPIPAQLADGVRGLLIDTHYGERLKSGRVRTVLDPNSAVRGKLGKDALSKTALDSALRLRDRAGFRGKGERGLFLCHTLCEIGATPLPETLDSIRDFLVAHPGEVMVVINEDYVKPADYVAAVRRAGLEKLAYSGPIDDRRPTLGQMVDSGRRVVFLAENRAGGAPWYRFAYRRLTEETPYAFSKPEELTQRSKLRASCRPGRGPREGAPLFLMNNWVTTDPLPKPSNAKKVNSRAALVARARECRRVRGHIPNLLAVDFYRQGDLFGAVDELNGVRSRR